MKPMTTIATALLRKKRQLERGITEEGSSSKREEQTFHGEVKVLGDRPVHLALSVPTTIDGPYISTWTQQLSVER